MRAAGAVIFVLRSYPTVWAAASMETQVAGVDTSKVLKTIAQIPFISRDSGGPGRAREAAKPTLQVPRQLCRNPTNSLAESGEELVTPVQDPKGPSTYNHPEVDRPWGVKQNI